MFRTCKVGPRDGRSEAVVMSQGFVEATLRFQANPRGGMPISSYEGELVILGRRYATSQDVKAGETWSCILKAAIGCMVARAVERVDPPPEPDPAPQASGAQPEGAPALEAAPLAEGAALAELPLAPEQPIDEEDDVQDDPRNLAMPPEGGESEAAEPLVMLREHCLADTGEEAFLRAFESISGSEKVAIFVHGRAAEAATDEIGWLIDWQALRVVLLAGGQDAGAYYYDPGMEDEARAKFHDMLARYHYTVPPKLRRASWPRAETSEWGPSLVEFSLLVGKIAGRCDVVYLLIHDADFLPLVDFLQRAGKRVFVVSTRNLIAPELARAVNKPLFYLEDIEEHLGLLSEDHRRAGGLP